ncbi:MAG: xanthine dehydrogenase molybdopterin binding subunit [Candidatus Obscuribacterales bacterium]|nr:xanthine dehydrogenase molybdopterin binding subunit [Candidatus Obscuribacterales bacterium]
MSAVGRDIPHDSAKGHVTGESIYLDDVPPVRGELLVDFFYAKTSHAKVKSLDLTEAAKVPGVVALLTHKDLLGSNLFGPITKDEIILVEDEIMFMGQPIVIIGAEDRKAIEAAKAAIKIELEPLEAILSIKRAKELNSVIGPTRRIKRGDVEATLKNSAHVIENTFRNEGQEHFYLESQAAIAYPKENNQIEVHSSTQHPSEVQEVIAHFLGVPVNHVVCITKRMGGGFGGKESQATHPAVMASLVAFKTKRAARIIFNKDHDMQCTGKRHPFENTYKVGFDKDGRITALWAHLYSDGGAYNDLSSAVMARAMCHIDNAYWLPVVDVSGTICKTHFPPNTAFRGFGGPQGIATIENIMEEIAAYLGKDPLDVRKVNLYGVGENNITPYGEIIFDNNLHEIFENLEISSDYSKRKSEVDKFNRESKTHLKGIALSAVKFGISFNTKFLNQANALVNIYIDGSIQVSTGATEMGQGVNTNIKQIVASEFDIEPDQVIVMPTSTEKNNNTSATAASSATDLNGSAAVIACEKIKEGLTELAAHHLASKVADINPSPSSIRFEGGFVFDRRRPDTRLTFKELVKIAYMNRVSLGERGYYATKGLDWSWDAGPEGTASGHPFLYYTQGAAVSEVTIDRFTGELKVERVDILMDIGKPVNPGIARGQLTGAFIQGMGWVTTECLKYAEDGTLLSHSPTTYKIPNIQDTPEVFNVNWIDKENSVNVKGTKAVGEPPLCLGLSVWCAVKYALRSVSGAEIPKLILPASNEEIVMRLAEYESKTAQKKPADALT